MKLCVAVFALAAGFGAQPLRADVAPANAGQIAISSLTDNQIMECMVHLAKVGDIAEAESKQSTLSSQARAEAAQMYESASRGFAFYAGVIYSRPWVENRRSQFMQLFEVVGQESEQVASDHEENCWRQASRAQRDFIDTTQGKSSVLRQ